MVGQQEEGGVPADKLIVIAIIQLIIMKHKYIIEMFYLIISLLPKATINGT